MLLIFLLLIQYLVFFFAVVSGISADLLARCMMSVAVLTAFTTLYFIKRRFIISEIFWVIIFMLLLTMAYVVFAYIVVAISGISVMDAMVVHGCLQLGLYAMCELILSGIADGQSGDSVSYYAGFDEIRYGKVYTDGFFDVRVVDDVNGHECRFSISELDNLLFNHN